MRSEQRGTPRAQSSARGVRLRIAAGVLGVIPHHLHQRLADFGVAVDDEQLHYCVGSVSGGANRFSSFVGSARTSCSWSL